VTHRAELVASEVLAGEHLHHWTAGRVTPVTEALDGAFDQWRALSRDERLVYEWPSPRGRIVAAIRA
jgi:hypothetical protein